MAENATLYIKENLPESYNQLAYFVADQLVIGGDYLYHWMIENPIAVFDFLLKNRDVIADALLEDDSSMLEVFKPIIDDACSGEYAMTEESFYLAIGADPAFAELLAGKLYLADRYAVNAWDNISLNDIQKADLITLSYNESDLSKFAINQAQGYIAEYLDVELRASLNAYVEAAFTTFFNNWTPAPSATLQASMISMLQSILNGTIDDVKTDYLGDASMVEMDWAAVVGQNNVAYVDDARIEMKNAILNAGIPETFAMEIPVVEIFFANIDMFDPAVAEFFGGFDQSELYGMFGEYAVYTLEIPAADALTFAGESYAYGYVQFAKSYAQTVQMINAINPDATVVLLGHYNAFAGVDFYGVDLGDLYGDMAQAFSAQAFAYAVLYDNVVFVDILEAETIFAASTNGTASFGEFLFAYMLDSSITNVSDAGNEYICDQILGALNITDPRCHHIPNEDDGDCTTAVTCSLCGKVIIAANEAHTPDADADCTNASYCTVCGKEIAPATGHTEEIIAGKDATCTATGLTEGKKCSACGEILVAQDEIPALGHTWAEATCTAPKTCTVCGVTEGVALGHTEVTVAGYAATCTEDGLTAGAKCADCGQVLVAQVVIPAAGHTPAADDGDCTTAVVCTVCGKVTTPAAAKHTFGDWVITKEATETEDGERQRVCAVCGTVETKAIPANGEDSATEDAKGLGAGAIVAISVAGVVVVGVGAFALVWFVIKKKTWADFLLIFKK